MQLSKAIDRENTSCFITAKNSDPTAMSACPLRKGAVLLGIPGPSGIVGDVNPRIQIDQQFVAAAGESGEPERKFRVATECSEDDCAIGATVAVA